MFIRFTQIWYCYLPLDSQYVCQSSARLKCAYVSYSNFCKVCEMIKKENYMKICWLISRERLEWSYSYLEYGLPCMEAEIWCHLEKTSQSYRCVKIATLLFLSIYSLFLHAPCFLGKHDMCLDPINQSFLAKSIEWYN